MLPEDTDKIYQRKQRVTCEDAKCLYEDCNKVFRTKAALTIHQKWLRRDFTTTTPLFVCRNRGNEFKQEGSMKNHYKGYHR